MCVHACRSSFFTLLRTDERTTRGAPIPSPLPVTFFFSFFFLFAMLMRDELACIVSRRRCRRRPSVRPSVSPRHEAGSFLSSLTYSVAQTDKSGPPDRWWSVDIFAAERHIQKKRKRKYGSLCLDAHKFRTPLVLGKGTWFCSTPPHHKPALHYCTTCYY